MIHIDHIIHMDNMINMRYYMLTGISNGTPISSLPIYDEYAVTMRRLDTSTVFIRGPPLLTTTTQIHDITDKPIRGKRFIRRSKIILIQMVTDDDTDIPELSDDTIHDILHIFFIKLNDRYPMDNTTVSYTYDKKKFIHVQLLRLVSTYAACDPDDPLLDAYPYKIGSKTIYLHSSQVRRRDFNGRTLQYRVNFNRSRLPAMPRLLNP